MNSDVSKTQATKLTATLAGRMFFGQPGESLKLDSPWHYESGERGLILAWVGRPRFEDGGPAAFLATFREQHWKDPTTFLARIRGPFAIALCEPESHRCLLAIDRLGIMPLAYRKEHQQFLFSSTLDLLRESASGPLELDPRAIFDYLYFHMIPAPRTIYCEVYKLEPGSFVICSPGGCKTGHYWKIPYREESLSRAEAAEQLRHLLGTAVDDNLDRENTGSFLSGGLDSTTVSGYLSQHEPKPRQAFSVGFDAEGYDETPWARAAAEYFGLRLNTYHVTPEDVMDALPKIAAAYDEPFGNASAIPAYFCARQAREHGIECLLAGDGGDEVFAGNSRYAKQLLFAHYDRLPQWLRHKFLEPLARKNTPLHRLPGINKAVSYVRQASLPMPERMESYNLLRRSGLKNVFTPEFLTHIEPGEELHHLNTAYRGNEHMSLLKHMLALDMKITLADNDLRKVSHMCRLAGIDVRYPMLDETLVEFAAGLPSHWLLEKGELRSFYRRSLADFLPRSTLEKSKHGFGLPFGVWAAEHPALKELTHDALSKISQQGWIQPAYIEKLKKLHTAEHAAYYGVMIWILIMLQCWKNTHAIN